MANTIKIKRASGSDPGNSDLAVGELAIRTSNCKLFSKNDGGSAVGVVAGSADTLTTARNIAGVSFDGSANISLNNNAITNGAGYIADLVSDTSPQLGGDLDMNSQSISSGILNIKNTGSQSEVRLYCEVSNAHYISLKAPAHSTYSGNLTYTLPPTVTNGYFLQTNGSGVLSWAAVNTDLVNDTSPQLGGDLQSNGNNIDFADNDKAFFGSSNDMLIEHDGSHSYIDNNTGDLIIRCDGDDVKILSEDDVVIRDNDDSTNMLRCVNRGAVEAYHNGTKTFETATNGVIIRGPEGGAGEIFLNADEGDDFADIFRFQVDTSGVFTISNGASGSYETNIECNGNGSVELYHNNVKALSTTTTGVGVFGNSGNGVLDIIPTGSATYSILNFHNVGQSSNSQIITASGQSIYVGSGGSGDVVLRTANSDNKVRCIHSGSVALYHNTSKKAETVSGGFTVTGTCTATAFSGDGSALTNLPSSGLPLSGGELTGDLTTHVVKPDGNGTRSLGTSSLRWSDVFTSDLHLSNKGSSNKVDNSWGDFTIQEGMEDLFLINNRNGKMYKFVLKEVG